MRRLALDRERDQLAYHATLAHELSRRRAEGKAEDKAEDKAMERLELLKRILMARPEPCPPEYLERLERASPEQLLTWFEPAIANKSVQDIFAS